MRNLLVGLIIIFLVIGTIGGTVGWLSALIVGIILLGLASAYSIGKFVLEGISGFTKR